MNIVNLFNRLLKNQDYKKSLSIWFNETITGFQKGAINMVPVAIAIACAGIIVGSVSSSGLSNAMVEVVEIVSGGNFYILLLMVMVLLMILKEI